MASDLPCGTYLALYIVSMHILNTRTTTHWKLNSETGKVQSATPLVADGESSSLELPPGAATHDPLMSLLTKKIQLENGEWKLEADEPTCNQETCQKVTADNESSSVNR